jgi:hypothetical protein
MAQFISRFLLSILCLLVFALPAGADMLAAWTEATGTGASVRVVTDGACPMVRVDGADIPMVPRAAPDPGFPGTVCQIDLPKGATAAAVAGEPVPVWPTKVDRIVVIGDTGCRLKGSFIQDCDDPVLWPFAAIAARAATEKPDLVIHVGDYYYRESACPEGRPGCAGSPHGDAWPAWDADFFRPAKPLLAAAPWVFVRGNHEQCGRGGLGWFRLLDAGPVPLTCPASARPYAVSIGPEHLFVVDSADTEDAAAPAEKVALFRAQLDGLGPALEHEPGWLLTHRPIWGFVPDRVGEVGESDELPVNRTEQAAASGRSLAGIGLVVSGHVHMFAAAGFGKSRPAQLIVGNGGDTRDGDRPEAQAHAVSIAGRPAETFVVEQFGYLVLDRTETGWRGTLRAVDGRVLGRCGLVGRDLLCGDR